MSRYRSRAGLKANEGKLPHHVDMMVPKGGFGVRLNEMHDWHYARSIEAVRGAKAATKSSAGVLLT